MNLKILTPKQSINKAYLKQKVSRAEFESFKNNLIHLFKNLDENESEEHLKNQFSDFLKNTYYKDKYYINTKDRKDLVIHLENNSRSSVGVLMEVKRPNNHTEMITKSDLNKKAFHELLLYYLRERLDEKNYDLKYLIVTNVYEWFLFDAQVFETIFYKNNNLKKEYRQWKDNQKTSSNSDLFYKEIANKYISQINDISFTHFDLKKYINDFYKLKDERTLLPIYKIFSPANLLKEPFTNDSNSLDKSFYNELLHIIGLEEIKSKSKKLIQRKSVDKRDEASILENTINYLLTRNMLSRIEGIHTYGKDANERIFNYALELCLTWINRILFLKLLEAQLYSYHLRDEKYKFLNEKTIRDFDELDKLFFEVLAQRNEERTKSVKEKFQYIPYLNSSLFEPNKHELSALFISNLDGNKELPIYSSTVLKDKLGKRLKGTKKTLYYIFEFLDAYDFTSEGNEEIQEDNKALINASVLGLIFEKINGYKEGSFFTPGYITMYMSKETVRKAIVQKFNEKYDWKCEDIDDVKNYLADRKNKKDILEANKVINDLKVCDPAVGSGHFLVSVLNEIISIKSELGILADSDGLRLSNYEAKVENDDLIITYNEGNEFYSYKLNNQKVHIEIQRVQKTLFNEKKQIIENCLFGVDINPNSVKIARLRLWIELLKNAYYTEESKYLELETLPNIDINIKQGNSLISRFPISSDLKQILKSVKWKIEDYRTLVFEYKNENNKENKIAIRKLIDDIKENFKTQISALNPKRKRINDLTFELHTKYQTERLIDIELSKKDKLRLKKDEEKLIKKINKLSIELKTIEEDEIYNESFEWRFEFPEILSNNGDFLGFDIVIQNPPYVSAIDLKKSLSKISYDHLKKTYTVAKGTVDLYVYFFERGYSILKEKGELCLITPNRYLSANYGKALREYLINRTKLNLIIDCSDVKVFEEASTYPIISFYTKDDSPEIYSIKVQSIKNIIGHQRDITYKTINSHKLHLIKDYIWGFLLNDKLEITEKVIQQCQSILDACSINATSTANEADQYNKLINDQKSGYKLVNTGTIDRYKSLWGEVELVDKGEKFKKPYLPKNSKVISNNRHKLYNSEKIIFAKIALTTEAFYDEKGDYASINTNCAHSFKNDFDPKYVLSWVNSKLFQYVFNCFFDGLKMAGGYLGYTAPTLSSMYIKKADQILENKIIQLVDNITLKKVENSDTNNEEKSIDSLFYNLFNLNKEEIKKVENNY